MNKRLIRLTENDLHRIVFESVNRILENKLVNESEDSPLTVTIDGKPMTFKNSKEYKKFMQKRKAQKEAEKGIQPEKKKVKREKTTDSELSTELSPKALAESINNLMYDKTINSIAVFTHHGERSFGRNSFDALKNLCMRINNENSFNNFLIAYNDIRRYVSEIVSWGRNDEHAVYERCQRISNLIDDLCNAMVNISSFTSTLKRNPQYTQALPSTRILTGSGNGREFGLYDLITAKGKKLSIVINNLREKADMLSSIAQNGRNPLDYEV